MAARLVATERTLVWVRWAGGLLALPVIFLFGRPFPAGVKEFAVGAVIGLFVLNVPIAISVVTPRAVRHPNALAIGGFLLDAAFVLAMVSAFTFSPTTGIWVLLFLVPLEGATKYQLPGALIGMALVGAGYIGREYEGRAIFGNPFDPFSIAFRLGVGFAIAAVVGSMARSLIEEHRRVTRGLAGANRMLLQAVGRGVVGFDNKGKITFANPAAAELLGWQPEALVGRAGHSTFHHTKPDGSPNPDRCKIRAAFEDGTEQVVDDEIFWRADGTSFPVRYTATPTFEGADVSGAVVTFEDRSARDAEMDKILATQAHLDSVLEEAPVILVAFDSRGTITLSRGRALGLLHMKPGEHEGKSVLEAYRGREEMLDFVLRALEGERHSHVIEVNGRRLQAAYSPVLDGGTVRGATLVAFEVREEGAATGEPASADPARA